MTRKIGYVWHLRKLMAGHGMFATTDLVPLLAMRGVALSREQVYRLVTRTPERLSLTTLAALCDILGCEPGDLVEPVTSGGAAGLVVSRVRGPPARPGRGGPRSCPGPARTRDSERAEGLPSWPPARSAHAPRRLFPLPPGHSGGPGRRSRPVAGPRPGSRGC